MASLEVLNIIECMHTIKHNILSVLSLDFYFFEPCHTTKLFICIFALLKNVLSQTKSAHVVASQTNCWLHDQCNSKERHDF